MSKPPKPLHHASPVTPDETDASASKRKRRMPSGPLRRSKRKSEKPGEWWKITKRPERPRFRLDSNHLDADVDDLDTERPAEKSSGIASKQLNPRRTRSQRETAPNSRAPTGVSAPLRSSPASLSSKVEKETVQETIENRQENNVDDDAEMGTEIEAVDVFTPVKVQAVASSSASPKVGKKEKCASAPYMLSPQVTIDFTTPPALRRLHTVTSPPPNAPRKLFKPPARFRTPLNRNQPSPGSSPATAVATPISITRSSELKSEAVGCANVSTALTLNGSMAGELLLPPRSSTDQRRADDGDEFFCLVSGVLECSISHVVVTISAGDYIAIPHMSNYTFHNRLGVAARLIFFAPRPEETQRYNGTPSYLKNL